MNRIKYTCIYFHLFFALLFSVSASGQVINPVISTSENFISTKIIKKSGITDISQLVNPLGSELSHQVSYFNGLGHPMQSIQTMASPLYRDIVQPVEYDDKGRETFKYQPYAEQSGNGSYKPNALTTQGQYYSVSSWDNSVTNTSAPYSKTVFDSSPLNRIKEQGAPGTPWQPAASRNTTGRTVVTEYSSNDDSMLYGTSGYGVRLWTATPVSGTEYQRSLSTSGLYARGALFLKITKDENWKSTNGKAGTIEEYTDNDGRLVLKRTFKSSSDVLSTYYVYDDMGHLSFVLTPASDPDAGTISQTTLDQFCIQYRYDHKGRLIEKRMPAAGGWTEYIYNVLDKVVFSQDANEAVFSPWPQRSFVKYDGIGRVIMTGVEKDHTSSRTVVQDIVNGAAQNWETRDNGSSNYHGYTNGSIPGWVPNMTPEVVNYYDDYDIIGLPSNESASFSNKTQGLLTASKVLVLGTSNYLWTINYYDDEGQLVKQYKQYYQSGAVNPSNYDEFLYTYNFAGALTTSTRIHHHTGSANTTIANRYEYDHSGRRLRNYEKINADAEVLLSEISYNEIGQVKSKLLHNGLNTNNYTYNPRGWLRKCTSNQFSYQLNYQDGTTPLYNGNISEQLWGAGSSLGNTFVYSYDKLNRLTSGVSAGMSESITYDAMGNILNLNRDGVTRNYFYTGNRLNNTTGAPGTGTYQYDANGNATYDGRLGQAITYNRLNLPSAIPGLGVTYIYDTEGNKLSKTSGGVVTDYIDGIQYTSGNIALIQTEEGIARRNGSSYSYEYNLTDNLDNVRYTFYRNPVTGLLERLQSDDYYPFGLRKSGSPVSFNNKYLYTGKEIQDELSQYDYGARFYDPLIGRWNVVDPLNQIDDMTPYNAMANNPILYADPDGKFIPLVAIGIGALVGGTFNVVSHLASGKAMSFKDGVVAFGIGAVAGGVGVATAGSTLVAGGAITATSVLGGMMTGAASTVISSTIEGGLNALYFGDSFSAKQVAVSGAVGAFTGGIFGGLSAPKGANIWTGNYKIDAGPVFRDMDLVRELGKAGEDAVGITGTKDYIKVDGRIRIPDRLTPEFLEEVKNVKHLSFTSQLRDFYKYSQDNKLDMILHVRPTTTFTGPLRTLFKEGKITKRFIPIP